MASPFDNVTESDKLRSFVDSRAFEEDLAASNARIFQAEQIALGLDKERKSMAEAETKKAAEDAFAQNVIANATDEQDLLKRAKEFSANNLQYARFVPEQVKNANAMFEGAAIAKQRGLVNEQQQLALDKAKQVQELEIKSNNSKNELSYLQTERQKREEQAQQIIKARNPLSLVRGLIDPSNPVEKALARRFESDYKGSTETDQEVLRDKYSQMFDAFNKFRVIQNNFSSKTIGEYAPTIAEIGRNNDVKTAYSQWRATKTPEELSQLDDGSAFVTFLGEASLTADDPDSIGYKISNLSGDSAKLINRAGRMVEARKSYNDLLANVDQQTGTFKGDPFDIDMSFMALNKQAELAYGVIEAESKAYQEQLKTAKAEADIADKTQESLLDAQKAKAGERRSNYYTPEAEEIRSKEADRKSLLESYRKAQDAVITAKGATKKEAEALRDARKQEYDNIVAEIEKLKTKQPNSPRQPE